MSDFLNDPKYIEWCANQHWGHRKDEYEKRGVTTEAMVVALWEKIVENRPEKAEELQVIRNEVKQQIPKT